MKKLFWMAIVVLGIVCFMNSASQAEIEAGFANSTCEVLDHETIKLFGINVNGAEGLWWVTFAWDANELKLIPVEAGPEKSLRAGDCAVGAWTMTFDWECDGTARTTSWYLFPDHKFVAGGTDTGQWTQSGNQVFLTYTNGTSYTGNLDDLKTCKYMTGKMSKGSGTGCFYAYRVSGTDTGSYDDAETKTLTGEEWLTEKANHVGITIQATCSCSGLTTPYCSGNYFIAGYTEVVNGVVENYWGDDTPASGGFVNLKSHTLTQNGVVCHDHIKAAVCNPY